MQSWQEIAVKRLVVEERGRGEVLLTDSDRGKVRVCSTGSKTRV